MKIGEILAQDIGARLARELYGVPERERLKPAQREIYDAACLLAFRKTYLVLEYMLKHNTLASGANIGNGTRTGMIIAMDGTREAYKSLQQLQAEKRIG